MLRVTVSGSEEVVPANEVPAHASAEAAAIRERYRATLEWRRLEGRFFLLHVLDERGNVIDGGVGDDAEDALLEVYRRLLPPD